jgi:hypothetical protein
LLDELAFQERVTLCCVGCTPAPARDSETEPFDALLKKASVEEVLPEACGAKVMLNEAVCPEAIVTGKEIPLTENGDPVVMPAEVTVTEPLLALNVAVCFCVDPTVTFPKFMLAGFTASCPAVTVLPVPVRGIESGVLAAFEVIESAPLAEPVDVGAKATLKVKLWLGLNVTGGVMPLKLKPVPLGTTCDIVTAAVLEFVKVSESVFFDPVCTEPKLKLVGLEVSCPPATLVPESATFRVGLGALLVIARFPLNVPADLGANVTA